MTELIFTHWTEELLFYYIVVVVIIITSGSSLVYVLSVAQTAVCLFVFSGFRHLTSKPVFVVLCFYRKVRVFL